MEKHAQIELSGNIELLSGGYSDLLNTVYFVFTAKTPKLS